MIPYSQMLCSCQHHLALLYRSSLFFCLSMFLLRDLQGQICPIIWHNFVLKTNWGSKKTFSLCTCWFSREYNYLFLLSSLRITPCFRVWAWVHHCQWFIKRWQSIVSQSYSERFLALNSFQKLRRMSLFTCVFRKMKRAYFSAHRWLERFSLTKFNPCFSSTLLVCRFCIWEGKKMVPVSLFTCVF